MPTTKMGCYKLLIGCKTEAVDVVLASLQTHNALQVAYNPQGLIPGTINTFVELCLATLSRNPMQTVVKNSVASKN